jgi:hypothetical protein
VVIFIKMWPYFAFLIREYFNILYYKVKKELLADRNFLFVYYFTVDEE